MFGFISACASIEGKVVSWNVKDGLADEARAEAIANLVAEQEPSVVVLCEAAPRPWSILPQAVKIFSKAVGPLFEVSYRDTDGRRDTHSLVMLVRPDLGEPMGISLGRRTGMISPTWV